MEPPAWHHFHFKPLHHVPAGYSRKEGYWAYGQKLNEPWNPLSLFFCIFCWLISVGKIKFKLVLGLQYTSTGEEPFLPIQFISRTPPPEPFIF